MGTSGSILGRIRLQTLCAGDRPQCLLGRLVVFLYSGSVTESRDSTLSSLFLTGAACVHTACHSATLVWRALVKLVVKLVSFSFLFSTKKNKNKNKKLIFFFLFIIIKRPARYWLSGHF